MFSRRHEYDEIEKVMSKRVEVFILIGLCLASLILGLISGKVAQNMSAALFFYLMSGFFFFAIFRPRLS